MHNTMAQQSHNVVKRNSSYVKTMSIFGEQHDLLEGIRSHDPDMYNVAVDKLSTVSHVSSEMTKITNKQESLVSKLDSNDPTLAIWHYQKEISRINVDGIKPFVMQLKMQVDYLP